MLVVVPSLLAPSEFILWFCFDAMTYSLQAVVLAAVGTDWQLT